MKKIATLFGLVSFCLLFSNCKSDHPIQGVWVPTSYVMPNTIYHFKEGGTLLIRDVTMIPNDSITTWKVVNDSILDIGNENYHYQMVSNDSLYFDAVNPNASFYSMKLGRARKTNIDKSREQIERILLSNIWSRSDSTQYAWNTHFEFFDNKTMVYRYDYNLDSLYDAKPIDTLGNLQLETWMIDDYDDYHFLHIYYNLPLGNGNINSFYQLLDINQNSHVVLPSGHTTRKIKYFAKKNIRFRDRSKELVGSWTAQSSKDKFYSKNLYQDRLDKGFDRLFEGEVKMVVDAEHIRFQLDTIKSFEWNWRMNKDGRILLFEAEVDNPPYKGIHVELADILEFSKSKIRLRLFNNSFYAGINDPRRIYMNQVLEFTRQD